LDGDAEVALDEVVPTPVGVNRSGRWDRLRRRRCPHARGGEPWGKWLSVVEGKLSPRPWG